MSMYSEYIKEKLGDDVIETEQGFATYRFSDPTTVYILNIYIRPDYRKSGAATDIADIIRDIAKKKGCTKMLGSVVPSTKDSTISLKVLLGYGMKLDSSTNDFILFSKEI